MSESAQDVKASANTSQVDMAALPPGAVVGVLSETAPSENRVAIVPAGVTALSKAGLSVLVEHGAGVQASYSDEAYRKSGATVASRQEVLSSAKVLVTVGKPAADVMQALQKGQILLGMLQPLTDPDLAVDLAAKGVTAISLDGLPRTLSRAQSMDALTSQANIAGYKAAVLAASTFGRYFPLLITASGTAKPASLLVLGAGVAGLQAMGTAKRLGAVVLGYDVRPETRAEIQSVGAKFLELGAQGEGSGEGGYARALSQDELVAQQTALNGHIARQDIVITTAQVPGRRPPLLVTSAAIAAMKPGSVLIDIAASALGGNVEGSILNETIYTPNGVTIIGAGNLPATMPAAASDAFSHNVSALLSQLTHQGQITIDLTDEIQAGVVICHDNKIVQAATAKVVDGAGTTSAKDTGTGGTL